MFNCQLYDFQSFIEVNIGLCVAYLVLPRFRYRQRIKNAFLRFHEDLDVRIAPYLEKKRGKKEEQENENSALEVEDIDISVFRDAYLTRISEKEELFDKNEHGSKFFRHCFKPKTGIGIGKDQQYVSILIIILFFLLSITTIFPKYSVFDWPLLLLFIGCGLFSLFFITLCLIRSGIKYTSEIEALLKEALSDFQSTYSIDQYEASISKLVKIIVDKQGNSSNHHY